MSNRARTLFEIDAAILASAGMRFINREHMRSFSLNIFRTNARELIEALRHVSDAEHGLRLMAHENREAGTQAHREVSRRIHNFVAGAKTLVDHTRVFMKEHYDQSSVYRAYNEEVRRRFSEHPIAKFVHDLRNYLLHCGLPNSSMFIHYSRDPEQPNEAAQITTGIRLSTNDLLEWGGWTGPARGYLGTLGDELPLEALVNTYVSEVDAFQSWMNELLLEFHAADTAELAALREEYALSKGSLEDLRAINEADSTDFAGAARDPLSFQPRNAIEIDRMGDELLSNIRTLALTPTERDEFKSNRPIGTRITPDNLLEQPAVWSKDTDGNQVVAFLLKESGVYGLDSVSLPTFRKIIDAVLGAPWAERSLSRKFVEGTIIDWCRSSFGSAGKIKLTEAIVEASRLKVKSVGVWAPIAHLEIESGFAFGPVQILPISAEMIDRLEADGLEAAPNQEHQIREMFDRLRQTMQGYAAVVIRFEADSEYAAKEGLAIAREAVNLLRFFAPATSQASSFCPTSLLGSEGVPTSHVLVLGEDSFSYTEGLVPTRVAPWLMSEARHTELKKVLDLAGALIRTEHLDEFELAVRSGMILFSTAATCMHPSDRLVYTLSAMERVLLKHELEAAAYSVEIRMAQLLANNDVEAGEIAHNVRAMYRLRARHRSFGWSELDKEFFQAFVHYAQRLLLIALENAACFGTCAEFIEAIESIVRE